MEERVSQLFAESARISAALLHRDMRNTSAEDLALVRRWAEITEELQRVLWDDRRQREAV